MKNNLKIAGALGIPKEVMISGKRVRWNISPGDDAMFAQVSFTDETMHAVIYLNYLSKPVEAIGLLAVKDQITEITGALKRKSSAGKSIDLEVAREAVRTFHSHLLSMKSGPFVFSLSELNAAQDENLKVVDRVVSEFKNLTAKAVA